MKRIENRKIKRRKRQIHTDSYRWQPSVKSGACDPKIFGLSSVKSVKSVVKVICINREPATPKFWRPDSVKSVKSVVKVICINREPATLKFWRLDSVKSVKSVVKQQS